MSDVNEACGAEMWRDPWGVLHIRAQGEAAAFAALGYAHAQDRLWQMEATLRRGIGSYAAWAGKAGLPGDILARRMDTAGASRRDHAALGDEAKAMLQAYADGVNAFADRNPCPREYALIDARPGRWEPWHSVAVMRQTGFLMGSLWWKLWRAAALPYVERDQLAKLRFDDGGHEQLCIPSDLVGDRLYDDLAGLMPEALALLAANAVEPAGGSNNWALAPERTATGRPIVAGDPHRVLDMPSMYAQTHLACDRFDVIGLTVPGVPGFPHFAHNRHVAWCVTHAFMDLHDLFIEKFDESAENYLFKGEWLPVTHRAERIEVKGAADHDMIVCETHHGPVFAGDPASGSALTLASAQFRDVDRSFDAMLPMLRADTVEQLFEAGRPWGLVDHNLVAGDTSGTIGHHVRARVPKRAASAGWLPVPGWTGEHEWDGYIAFEDMPVQINPKLGALATANNRVVPAGGPHYFTTDCMPPHRARGIMKSLSQFDRATPEDMATVFGDLSSIPARELCERVAMLDLDGPSRELQRLLAGWDHRMELQSTAATAYAELRGALAGLLVRQSGLAAADASPYMEYARPALTAASALWWTLPQLLRADDTGLLGGKTWNDLLREAMDETAAKAPFAPWGEVHRPTFVHPLARLVPDRAAELTQAGAAVAGDNDTVFTTGYAIDYGFTTVYGAIARYVFDVGNWDNCTWIAFHGAAGDVESPWYMNQNADWSANRQVPMLFDWDDIAARAVEHRRMDFRGG